MLDWLRARNVGLLADVSLDFDPGLNVVTGETGAGKSVLLGSLALSLGARARAGLVGPAGSRAVVEVGFALPDGEEGRNARLLEALDAVGVVAEDGELVVRRELRRTPRGSLANRSSLNGTAVPVAALREVGSLLAEVYSQGEYRTVFRPGAAREAVDSAGGHERLAATVASAFSRLVEAEAEREQLSAEVERTASDRSGMERAIREIEGAELEPGEKEALGTERRVLAEAGHLRELLETAYHALYGSDTSAGFRLAVAIRALEAAAALDPEAGRLLEERPELVTEVEDLAGGVRERLEAVRVGPERREQVEERLALILRLERRYTGAAGGTDALLAEVETMRRSLATLTDRAEQERQAKAEAERAARRYFRLAGELSEARRTAGKRLEGQVGQELRELGMPRARFRIAVEPVPPPTGSGIGKGTTTAGSGPRPAAHGLDRIEFLFSANPGVEPGPIAQVASGGESTRFFLALKVAAAGEGAAALIFDEADTGTSGRIADAVGRRLRRLARSRQVVCVTHLPQVAALGSSQLVVEKLESGAAVRVRRLGGPARVEEIARMLAGPVVTRSARDHARALLAGASSAPPSASSAESP